MIITDTITSIAGAEAALIITLPTQRQAALNRTSAPRPFGTQVTRERVKLANGELADVIITLPDQRAATLNPREAKVIVRSQSRNDRSYGVQMVNPNRKPGGWRAVSCPCQARKPCKHMDAAVATLHNREEQARAALMPVWRVLLDLGWSKGKLSMEWNKAKNIHQGDRLEAARYFQAIHAPGFRPARPHRNAA